MKNLNWNQGRSRVAAFALVSLPLLAVNASAALPADLTTAMDDAQAEALLAIAKGGLMLLLIAVGGLVWRVAAKYIKRAGGSA